MTLTSEPTQVLIRRDTRWTASNPVLGAGEPAYDTNTHQLRVGDGTTPYSSLPSYSSPPLTGH